MKKYFRLLTGKIEKATRGSAAFDLFYNGTEPLLIGDKPVLITTGVTTEFSSNLVAIMKEKSGLSLKGLELKAGVIDSDYRKEWGVIARYPLHTPTHQATQYHFRVDPGMKVAQFLLVEVPEVELQAEYGAELSIKDEERVGGFGSTGK